MNNTLPPLPFEPGDTANLACVVDHSDVLGLQYGAQHTLVIARDEEDPDRNLAITIVWDGQPSGDITVSRAELLAALGVGVN